MKVMHPYHKICMPITNFPSLGCRTTNPDSVIVGTKSCH